MSSGQSIQDAALSANESASHGFLDRYQLALHERVAQLLIEQPETIIARARLNLKRWIESGNFTGGELASLREWAEMLEHLSAEELARRITDTGDEGQRIRQNSPLVRILPQEESQRIREACEERAAH